MFLRLRAWLSRLLAPKSPWKYDKEFGSWTEPDVVISDSTKPPPKPLVISDCRKSILVYNFNRHEANPCGFQDILKTMTGVIRELSDYFDKHFECKHKDCPKRSAEIIWFGLGCRKDSVGKTWAEFGMLVRFRCKVDIDGDIV